MVLQSHLSSHAFNKNKGMATLSPSLGDLGQTADHVEITIDYHILSVARRPTAGD